MANISINLLPIEFRAEEVKRTKFYKIQIIGIAAILIFVFLSSLTVALRILQSQNIALAKNTVSKQEIRVEEFKGTQATLILLQNRLSAIKRYANNFSKQNETYQAVTESLPSSVLINSLNIDKDGSASFVAAIADVSSLEKLFSAILKSQEDDQFTDASIDTLSMGRDGVFRLSIKLKAK